MGRCELFYSFLFFISTLSHSANVCIPIGKTNTGTATIACNYKGTTYELPGVEQDRLSQEKLQSAFSDNHLNLCDGDPANNTKEKMTLKLRQFFEDKSYINFIFSGHGTLTPVFDSNGKFLRTEWALILPSYIGSECEKETGPDPSWGAQAISANIKQSSTFRKRMQSYSKLCDTHFLKMSDIPFRKDMTATGIIDACHAGGAQCSLTQKQRVFMSSGSDLKSPDSDYDIEQDPEAPALLKDRGVTDPNPLLTYAGLLEEAQAQHGFSFPEKNMHIQDWTKATLKPWGRAVFKATIESRSKKDSETVKAFLSRFYQALDNMKIYMDVEAMRSNEMSRSTSFSNSLASRKLADLDINKDARITVAEFYSMKDSLALEAGNKPELHKGSTCAQPWLDKVLFDLRGAPENSNSVTHTSK